MQLDWFTLLAQIVNFLILVFLLKRFLYGRIIEIVNLREESIASRFAEAEAHAEEAAEEARIYRHKREEFERERDELMARVHQEAEARRRQLIDSARTEVEGQKTRWRQALAREKRAFLRALQQQAGRQVYAIARRALADLSGVKLEQQVVDVFVERLERLEGAEKEKLVASFQERGDQPVRVQSAFDLPAERQQAIQELLRHHFDEALSVQFNTNADLICGIALRVNGHQVTWNLQSYLDRLEQEVMAALAEALPGEQEKVAVDG